MDFEDNGDYNIEISTSEIRFCLFFSNYITVVTIRMLITRQYLKKHKLAAISVDFRILLQPKYFPVINVFAIHYEFRSGL